MQQITRIQNEIKTSKLNMDKGLELFKQIQEERESIKTKSENNFFMNNVNLSFKKPTAQKVFLYVPYEYRNDAKQDGFKWDNNVGNWYVMSNHPNLQRLKEKWHHACFRTDSYGTQRKYYSTKDIITKTYEDYDETKHGSYVWYSVNILGHE